MSIWRKYGYVWVTSLLFIFSLIGHWIFGWFAYVDEQRTHRQPVEVSGYTIQIARDTFENWQSEFLQLIWQVAGLTYFLYVGSPQSKEGNDRLEGKIDALLKKLDPDAEAIIRRLDEEFPGRDRGA
jgi:hypothetical protein